MKVCEEVPVENCQLVTRTVCDGDLDLKPQGSAPSNCKKVVKPSCRIDENCCKKETRKVCTTSDGGQQCQQCGFECSKCQSEVPFLGKQFYRYLIIRT